MKKYRFKSLAIALACVASLLSSSVVGAVEIPKLRLQISPPVQEIELTPGENYTGSFQVQNTGTEEFGYKVFVSPYSVTDENYSPDYETKNTYSQMADWIIVQEPSGTLPADEVRDVFYSVSVPEDVPAGDQRAIILTELVPLDEADTTSEGNRTAIKNISQVGSIIYAKMNGGETHEAGRILSNKTNRFVLSGPIKTESLVENTGNTMIKASCTMQVYGAFDNQEQEEPIYSSENQPKEFVVLPETKRLNVLEWEETPKLGLFKVIQTVEMLDETSTVEKIVLVCPLWFALTVAILIILCIIWLVTRIGKRRK